MPRLRRPPGARRRLHLLPPLWLHPLLRKGDMEEEMDPLTVAIQTLLVIGVTGLWAFWGPWNDWHPHS